MATTYEAQATVNAKFEARYKRTDELATAYDRTNASVTTEFGPTPDNEVDVVYRKSFTDAASISLGGSSAFADGFGNARSFSAIKALMIINKSTDPDDAVLIGEVNDFDGILAGTAIPAGGVFLVTAPGDGWPVIETSSMLLSGDNDVLVDIAAVGIASEA